MTPANSALEFELHCKTDAGDPVQLLYRPHQGVLTDGSGTPLLADLRPQTHEPAVQVSPATPGWKSREVQTLKIQLGMACNYHCSYCSQASAAPEVPATRTADVDEFLRGLVQLRGAPDRIEFWGGEPLLYFAKLRRLVPALRQCYPEARFSMVTNGTLLDADILDFIERWDIYISVSHDGPGQAVRGPDPFDDPKVAPWLARLWQLRGHRGRVSFNVVFTPANADLAVTRRWFEERVADSDVVTDAEGVVSVYDDHTLNGAGRWTEKAYETLRASIVEGFATGTSLKFSSIRHKAREFVASLHQQQPSSALWQKCGMDVPNQLAVDLKGRVMTCHNTGAHGRHHIGEMANIEQVRLDTATHWSHRETCRHCPVVQLCRGSCMYLEGDHFAQSCENEYRYNSAILEGLLLHVTGLRLERITGDIRRPRTRRTIPIAAMAA